MIQLRQAAGLTQAEVAERAYGNIRRQGNIAYYEKWSGEPPRIRTIQAHAKAFRLTVSQLLKPVDEHPTNLARKGKYDKREEPLRAGPPAASGGTFSPAVARRPTIPQRRAK